MENLTIFVLGAISALGLFGLGYAIIGVLKMNKQIKKTDKQISELTTDIFQRVDNLESEINRQISDEISSLHSEINKLSENLEREVSEVYRKMDSRFDKTIDSLCNRMDTQDEESLKITMEHSKRLAELETVNQINS